MRTRRHTAPVFGSLRSAPWGRFARDLGLVALTFVVGYIASSFWIAPGPLLGSNHAVPRVLGLPMAEARTALAAAGFRSRIEGERPNPGIAPGDIVWQDPPPGTAVAPNAVVQLVSSAGPAPVTVPDVMGLALPYARKVIEAAGDQGGQGRHRPRRRPRDRRGHRHPAGAGERSFAGRPGGPGRERRRPEALRDRAHRAEHPERRPRAASGAGRRRWSPAARSGSTWT